MIGRDSQLTTILDLINDTVSQGGFILIEGEAGIGKSFLARAAVANSIEPI